MSSKRHHGCQLMTPRRCWVIEQLRKIFGSLDRKVFCQKFVTLFLSNNCKGYPARIRSCVHQRSNDRQKKKPWHETITKSSDPQHICILSIWWLPHAPPYNTAPNFKTASNRWRRIYSATFAATKFCRCQKQEGKETNCKRKSVVDTKIIKPALRFVLPKQHTRPSKLTRLQFKITRPCSSTFPWDVFIISNAPGKPVLALTLGKRKNKNKRTTGKKLWRERQKLEKKRSTLSRALSVGN